LNNAKPDLLEGVRLNFLDIIFGVIIGISFTDSKSLLVPFSFSFETLTLLLAYSIVFSGWLGYHYFAASVEVRLSRPEAEEGREGQKSVRDPTNVVMELVTLYLYFYLLGSVKDFSTVVGIMPVIFGLGLIWFSFIVFRRVIAGKAPAKSISDLWGMGARLGWMILALLTIQAFVYYSLVHHFERDLLGASWFDWCILITSIVIWFAIPPLLGYIFASRLSRKKLRKV